MDDNELDRLFGEVSESGSKPENEPSKDKEKEPSDKEAGDSERAEEVLRKNGFIISKYEESSGDDEDGTDEETSENEETEGSEDAEEGADSEENDEEGDDSGEEDASEEESCYTPPCYDRLVPALRHCADVCPPYFQRFLFRNLPQGCKNLSGNRNEP